MDSTVFSSASVDCNLTAESIPEALQPSCRLLIAGPRLASSPPRFYAITGQILGIHARKFFLQRHRRQRCYRYHPVDSAYSSIHNSSLVQLHTLRVLIPLFIRFLRLVLSLALWPPPNPGIYRIISLCICRRSVMLNVWEDITK
uniref:Uncharacterized protein n=1 Tax=Schizaphis graminum TaxID=13262 RepID=A0A2S2N9E3_SCHGA